MLILLNFLLNSNSWKERLQVGRSQVIIPLVVILLGGLFITFLTLKYGVEKLLGGLLGLLFVYGFICISIFIILRPLFPRKNIYLNEYGIKVNSKKISLIEYHWIEKVILNCRLTTITGDVLILFKKDNTSYLYIDFQRRIRNYKEFVDELSKRNIKVEIWEKSYFFQQQKYLDWLSTEMRKRIIV